MKCFLWVAAQYRECGYYNECIIVYMLMQPLFLQDPLPSPPEPMTTAVNSIFLHVSWPPLFTYTNYCITLTNTANTNCNEDTIHSIGIAMRQASY